MNLPNRYIGFILATISILLLPALGVSQTYHHTWTTTSDFDSGDQVGVNATDPEDQLQLNLDEIETPYLWVANTSSNSIARIDTSTGRALSVTGISGSSPSRTAVDLDYNCWVGVREQNGRAFKISADTGLVMGSTPYVGRTTRGVAINGQGDVWISSSENDGRGFGWMKINPNTMQPIIEMQNSLGSYGIAINPFGKMFTSTSWLGGASVQRLDAYSGRIEQRWNINHMGGNVYGITVDLNGDPWGAIWSNHYVLWIDGSYECPNGQENCVISNNNGINREINVSGVVTAAGGTTNLGGRGIAVDANGFIWAVFNDLGTGQWTSAQSYVVKIDGHTGDPVWATPSGRATVGVTPDADGYIWAVNYNGGGQNFVAHSCPNGWVPTNGGSVTKIRSSDGSVVATYPTCGNAPYTYSDMAGYNLRSVTLRSGTWNATHDSGQNQLEWGRINWRSQEFDDTIFTIKARSADRVNSLPEAIFVELENNDDMPLVGRFMEVEAFLYTRNDFLGPVLEDLTISSVCSAESETCDGLDNDCDGEVDNGNPGGGETCETGLPGICGLGESFCNYGRFDCIVTIEPQSENCNGVDDDCDGTIDEGVLNRCNECGEEPEEICNGIDDDCDRAIDEDLLNQCGECGPVPTEICNGVDDDCDGGIDEGLTNPCGECGQVPTETCNGVDDDCDGLVDEGVVNACGTCGDVPIEVCDYQDNDCDGLIDEGTLNACGDCGELPEEVCDGADNNCNGMIDEGTLNDCGFCGPNPEEVCDGIDNDCDGAVDEEVTNVCGGCGDDPIEVCDGFDNDCDSEIDEGVLNSCGGCGIVPDEICDGLDNDCDGAVDEGVTNLCGSCGVLERDTCDNVDNDCDGIVDEDAECEEESECFRGECAKRCAAGECPTGFFCDERHCMVDLCYEIECEENEVCVEGICRNRLELQCIDRECPSDLVCIEGECVADPCVEHVACPSGTQCWLGECLDEELVSCYQANCSEGERCIDGECFPDLCWNVECDEGFDCVDGECIDKCNFVECSASFDCVEGECVPSSCFAVECTVGFCYEGNCVVGCEGVVCAEGYFCSDNRGCHIPSCPTPPCEEPEEVCSGSDCEDVGNPDETVEPTPPNGGKETCACSSLSVPSNTPLTLLLFCLILGVVIRRRRC